MKTVLAVAYGGGHIACLLPVIERLRARGDRVEVLALTTAAATCADHGIPCRRFSDFPEVQDARSRAHGQRLAAAQPAHPAVPSFESIAYLGANYRDLEDQLGIDEAAKRFATEGRQAFLPIASLTTIIRAFKPDAVLTTSAPRAERAAVLAARQAGIPAVVVVDLFALSEQDYLKDPAFGDVVCVLSGAVRDFLISLGRPAAQIRVTGNPVFDRLGDPQLAARAAALRRERGWEGTQVITWASQPEPAQPDLPRRIERALQAALVDHPTWRLVLRPHPSDQFTLPMATSQLVISTRADHLHTLLAASDCVVTMTSTVGLEAALLGRPLVTWDRSQNTASCPYSRMGMSLGVTELSGLAPALATALAGGAPKPALPAIGRGAEGVVAALDGLNVNR